MLKNRSFENLHKNHKWAFIDGLLTGVVLTLMAKAFREDIKTGYDI